MKNLFPGVAATIFPFLNMDLQKNFGCAFSLFSSVGKNSQLFFGVVGLALIFGLVGLALLRLMHGNAAWPEILIISGGLSNLLDRFLWGHVVDFISLHVGCYFWPTFNLADCFIVLGTIFLVARVVEE